MHPLHHLLANNRAWSEKIRRNRPDFFSTLSRQQAPKYLWIGCADSRVPANEICGLLPGELFVHRNVANLVNQTDINCLSVMHYAIDVLKVEHIIVCGHYGCGGVHAALKNLKLGLIDSWLSPIHSTATSYASYLGGIADEAVQSERLCELNVIQQSSTRPKHGFYGMPGTAGRKFPSTVGFMPSRMAWCDILRSVSRAQRTSPEQRRRIGLSCRDLLGSRTQIRAFKLNCESNSPNSIMERTAQSTPDTRTKRPRANSTSPLRRKTILRRPWA
jgi:carbonic anhydrase